MDNRLEIIKEAAAELSNEWALQPATIISEEALLQQLSDKIAAIITQGPDPFYRLMYRLDISEKKIRELQGSTDVSRKVAALVLARQLEKIKSRREHREKNNDIDPDLQW
jgi:DNA-binding CsgD family transcriptional regulator